MILVSVHQLSIRFRGPVLLDQVSCQIETKQRIGLLGRNGSGKSTFLRILSGSIEPDAGEVRRGPTTRLAMLPQDVPQDLVGSVHQIVAAGCPAIGLDAWQREHQVEQILSRTSLVGDDRFEQLSSGMKRRVLLARTLVSQPDLLLLDEPTNHLDIDAIEWLEEFLLKWPASLIFVTHDRAFLKRLATRILEIDRGQLFDWSCDYETFLRRKEEFLAAEEKQNALFDKMLAQEETWIRTGIKARRTRNEGRVRALEQMRRARQQRRVRVGNISLQIQEAQRSGTLVIHADRISYRFPNRSIVDQFSTMIVRGDKVGLVGPNGSGKTTLLRILLGELTPQSGMVRLGTNLQIAYFDQLRQQLDDDQTVQENVGDGYDTISIGDEKRHIIGYLNDFLFSAERARTLVRRLSGGERNRVLLAKLFAKPANVIVLDEPTNDLDAETIELLEERLVAFSGTVLLVSHDRTFLNNVVTSTIAFERATVREYAGGYDDWLRQRPDPSSITVTPCDDRVTGTAASQARGRQPESADGQPAQRLTFKERQELESLAQQIEHMENQIQGLHTAMADPAFFQQAREGIARQHARLKQIESDLASAYARWEELADLDR